MVSFNSFNPIQRLREERDTAAQASNQKLPGALPQFSRAALTRLFTPPPSDGVGETHLARNASSNTTRSLGARSTLHALSNLLGSSTRSDTSSFTTNA